MGKQLMLTGGSYAGRRITVPSGGVRPATNLVREAIFSTLLSFFDGGVSGRKVLDLFAGSGALGLEALSRGAAKAVFVDRSREALRAIRSNLRLLGFAGDVIGCDALSYLKRVGELDFDIVFIDPPYRYERTGEAFDLLSRGAPSGEGPLVIYERFFSAQPPEFGVETRLLKRKKYGQSEIVYFRISKGV